MGQGHTREHGSMGMVLLHARDEKDGGMKSVLVAGATGYLGRHVVKEFKNQGYWVRALGRNPEKLKDLGGYADEVFTGGVTRPESLSGACEGIEIVFSSIGITKQKDDLTYMDVDYQGNMNLLTEAKEAGVRKFVYVSVFNAEKMKGLKGVQAKLRFTDELKRSGLEHLVVYPNGFFSDMLGYLEMAKKGRGYVFGSGEHKINPIHGEDLAEAIVAAVAGAETELHIGGPQTLTHNQILTTAFEVLGKPPKITKVPNWLSKGLLAVLKTFTSVKTYGPIEFFMTVLAMDMVAPAYGNHLLKDFFSEHKAG